MVAVPAKQEPSVLVAEVPGDAAKTSITITPRDGKSRVLTMGRGYGYREANWQIGRAAERANVQVKQFVPGDRWTAWKRSQARIQANEEKKRLRNSAKKGKADKGKKKMAR
jgi:large subunit ribosomal protein L27